MSLAWLIILLFGAALAAWAAGRVHRDLPRWVSLVSLVLAGSWVAAVWLAGPDAEGIYSAVSIPWVPRFGIALTLSMDGLSLLLVALNLFLGVVAVAASWHEVEERTGFFQFNLIFTLTGVVGVFTALDLFAFFVFWEVMLVPMYFLIAIWGHENRGYAAMKFFLFTQISGLLLLIAIVALVFVHYANTGTLTFSYHALLDARFSDDVGFLLMLGFFAAFVVKLPGVPVHTWLPDAHTQAPTAGSVVLAGILLKTGAYGLIRFVVPLFPDAAVAFREVAMALGAVSVLYGGYMAYTQSDFKRLVAYSSVSHMGFVLLGVFAWNVVAVQGAVVQMVAHGFSSAALFMIAGALQHRLHTREMDRMGGLWVRAPRLGAIALFFVVASLGMPGLGTFVGEFLVLLGAFQVDVTLTVAATFGVVVAAVYSLSLMQRTFQGAPNPAVATMPDFDAREMAAMLAMAAGLVWLGVYPQPVLDVAEPVLRALGVAA